MLRSAVRAPARAIVRDSHLANRGPWQWPERCNQVGANSRRCFRTSRLCRAAEAEGDGISANIEYTGVWQQITTFPKRRPFATNMIVATTKTSLADILVQKAEGKKDIDWSRNGVFVAFGFVYLGAVQWFIYVTVFKTLCPNAIRFANSSWAEKLKDRAGQIDLVKQVCLDNFIHYTFVYFPVFYMFKELIQARDAGSDASSIPSNAMAKYMKNFWGDNFAIWGLWVPGDLVVYAVPIWMRLPLNHAISLAWTMILSWMRGNEK
eukprot:gnl/TRDRNA2_/TRDRNA2_186665_c0_seq1.p1 gnl/TRDRNA2_/TRDRNA2_186665_c0~~gnl/TRDRNA2_/TRDRNA2_186665_c0_seq1.p1  ORF type:complete len:290 (+),score=38.70 gnl/TRDRNA2_/TRDRNA2_186665_c0_seq1:81-872(+)